MSNEVDTRLAEATIPARKAHRLPKGCGFISTAAGILIGLASSALYCQFQIIEGVREKESHVATVAIGNAITQFYADHQRLPLPSGPSPQGGDRTTDTSPAHGFTAVLLGQESSHG